MAHELQVDEVTQHGMFSVKKRPWHGLGHVLESAPSVEDAIVYAGLDWQVGMKMLYLANGDVAPASATTRSDTGEILGVVGMKYQPLQNTEAFAFFNPFIESGLATLETAGCLFEGKRLFITAKINAPDSIIVPQADDRIEKFILLSNSHDGSVAVRVGFTPVRVVCNNTLRMAVGDKKSSLIRIKHGKNVKYNTEMLRNTMNLINQQFEATAEVYRDLASRQIVEADLKKAIQIIFKAEKTEEEFKELRCTEQILELFETGRGNHLKGVAGTRWAAYNGITEYLQYYRGRSDENRFNSLWFGDADNISKRALETLSHA